MVYLFPNIKIEIGKKKKYVLKNQSNIVQFYKMLTFTVRNYKAKAQDPDLED